MVHSPFVHILEGKKWWMTSVQLMLDGAHASSSCLL